MPVTLPGHAFQPVLTSGKKNGLCFCLTAQSCGLREGSDFSSGWLLLLLLSLKEVWAEQAVGGGSLRSCEGTWGEADLVKEGEREGERGMEGRNEGESCQGG